MASDGPVEDLFGRVEVTGQFVASAKRIDGGALLAEGLPPGRYQVRVSAKVGGRAMGATAVVEAGAEAHVALVENRSPFR